MLPHEWVSFLEEANIYWSDVWRGMQADDYIVKIEEYVDNLINYTLLKKLWDDGGVRRPGHVWILNMQKWIFQIWELG